MTTIIDWPASLSHGFVRFEPFGGGRGLGGAAAGPPARGAGTYGPILRARQTDLPLIRRNDLLAARALQAQLESGAAPIMLPACVGNLTPQLAGGEPLESAVGADAEAGADELLILLAGGTRGLRGGEWFSLDHDDADVGRRAYMVAELIDNTDPAAVTVRIVPRLRSEIAEEAVIDFLTPTAPFRLVDGFSLPTELGKFSGIEAVYEEWFDTSPVAQSALLRDLTLSPATILEQSPEDTFVGRLFGMTTGSTVTLVDDAGGRFKLVDESGILKIYADSVATDYDTATTHNITVEETLIGRDNSPHQTVLAIAVTEIPFTSFVPTGMEVWYDAQRQTEGDGVIIGNTYATPSQALIDWSGNGFHADPTGIGGGYYPTQTFDVINGMKAIFLRPFTTGAFPSYCLLPDGLMAGASEGSLYVVAMSHYDVTPGAETGNAGPLIGHMNSDPGHKSVYTEVDGSIRDNFGATALHDIAHPAFNRTNPHIYSAHTAPSDWRAYLNGDQIHTSGTNTVGWGSPSGLFRKCLGRSRDNFGFEYGYWGYIAEVLMWRDKHSTFERQQVEGYLAHKYDLTANLPGDHPYKVDPP